MARAVPPRAPRYAMPSPLARLDGVELVSVLNWRVEPVPAPFKGRLRDLSDDLKSLDDTAARLSYMRFGTEPYVFREDVITSDAIQKGVDDYVSQGADVIVATSLSQRDDILKKAAQYPATKFLTCGGFEPPGTTRF